MWCPCIEKYVDVLQSEYSRRDESGEGCGLDFRVSRVQKGIDLSFQAIPSKTSTMDETKAGMLKAGGISLGNEI